MKKAKWMTVLAAIFSLVVFGANSAHATASAYSYGDIYWNTLNVGGTAEVTFDYTNAIYSVSGFVDSWNVNLHLVTPPVLIDPDQFKKNIYSFPYTHVTDTLYNTLAVAGSISNNSFSKSLIDTSQGFLAASSAAYAYGAPDVVHSYAITYVEVPFSVTGVGGTLSLGINYSLYSEASNDLTMWPYGEYSYAREYAYASVVKSDKSNQHKDAEAVTELYGTNSGFTSDGGTLQTQGLNLKTGDTGYIFAEIISDTWAVPEPMSVTLLGLGLLGLGILSRSRKNS